MRQKNDGKLRNINALLLLVVITISIGVAAFAGMTIANTENLATYTDEIYARPYAASNAARQMRTQVLFARNTMLNMLTREEAEDSKSELDTLYRMRKVQPTVELQLRSLYAGDTGTVDYFLKRYHLLQSVHDNCIQLIHEGRMEEAEEILYTSAYTLYLEVDDQIEGIIGFSEHAMDGYLARVQELKQRTTQMAIIWGLVLIVLTVLVSILSVRSIMKRNAEAFHNNTLFHIIFENIDDVFMVFDCINERIEYLSDNSKRVLGIPAEACLQNIWIARAYFDEETFQRIIDAFRYQDTNELLEYEFKMIDPKTGQERECISKRYSIIENGRLIKYVFMTSDLTETKRSQIVLREALERAENANVAKREFLSRMSHEIRTPMNAMAGTLRALEYHLQEPQKAKEYIQKIDMSMKHLLDLIGDILDMSKIESGKLRLDIKEFSLNVMLGEIAAIMQPKASENKQVFDIVLKNITCDALKGDEVRIKQVLLNFLSNALKFTHENGKIRMTVEELSNTGNQVCLEFTVQDTGIGIQEAFLNSIFEPFEQEETSTYRKYGGTGLGMPLSKALVESMGGEIGVKSTPNIGSCFSFALWLERTDAEGISIKIPDQIKGMKVLIVEDDKEIREHLELLCSQLGLKTEAVASGVEAAKEIRKARQEFDLCLIDLYMPDVDGIRTAEWIRSNIDPDKKICIALMSAYDYKNVEKEAIAVGVNEFLNKPIMQADIYRILQKLKGETVVDSSEHSAYDFKGRRLLIAEDNELNMEVAKELCEHVGFEVEGARNGQEAVEKFSDSPEGYYDAILMDIQMPIMNGHEAARAIRKLKRKDADTIVIIAMTANAFYEDAAEAMKNGMNEHLSKPIEPIAIFASLKKFLYDNRKGI